MTDSLQQITDHVWLYPYNSGSDPDQPGVGAIITGDETVLVDAGNSPRQARQIRAALRAVDAPPVKYVIYTHHHWDHTFGAQIWYDSLVIAHAQCRVLLLERYGNRPWSRHYIQELSMLEPAREPALRAINRAIDDWSGFRLIMPHITFTGRMTLVLPEITLRLQHVGGQHAADSIIVQAEDVIFLGDCCYPAPPHLRQPGDSLDSDMVSRVLAARAATYIDAHGRPRTHDEVAAFLQK